MTVAAAQDVPEALKQARTRSVDNLQRLYTVVVSLALTESLRRLISPYVDGVARPGYSAWLTFVVLIVTVVPFYHGANRYLDATYVTGERRAKPEALMFDFIALFIEGLLLFALAMLANSHVWFYTVLAIALLFDAIWVGMTRLWADSEGISQPPYLKWASINVGTAALIALSVWSNVLKWPLWNSQTTENIILVFVLSLRTIYDYYSVWNFYYPKGLDAAHGNIPAPRPAPPPAPPAEPTMD